MNNLNMLMLTLLHFSLNMQRHLRVLVHFKSVEIKIKHSHHLGEFCVGCRSTTELQSAIFIPIIFIYEVLYYHLKSANLKKKKIQSN